jgi:hypothetical protein
VSFSNPNFFEGSFMNCRPIVISVVFALAAGIAASACQGGEDVLPIPPSDAGASSDGSKGDAASKDGASGDAAESDAAATKDAEGTETAAEAGAGNEGGSVGEAGPSDAASDAVSPDANEE